MTFSRRAIARAVLGIGVSVVAVWLLVRSVDLSAAAQVLRTADPAWIAVMFVTCVIDISARGARWRVLLAPIASIPYPRVLGYTCIGYLANNVLPARLGELVRSHSLGEKEGIARTTVLGTVVVERVIDTVMVVAIAAVSVLVLSIRGVMTSAVLLGLAFAALLVVGLGIGIAAHRLPGAERVAAYVERWPRLIALGRMLRDGLAVIARPRTLIGALAFSVLAWTASISTFLAAGQAVGLQLTVAQGALLASGVALATIVPSGPGYLGTFELTAVGICSLFGIERDIAFAMALLVHVMILAVTSTGGVIAWLALRGRTPAPAAATGTPDAPEATPTSPTAGAPQG
jgi:uncharacterized protein (TIRG00374 family)